jgi:very-short-patch-repair endonuclease
LHRLHPGVYAVGHVDLTPRARWLAAVAACRGASRTSALSHRAAGALHGILRSVPSGPIDVTSTGRHRLRGIRCHRVRGLHPDDVTTIDAIPVTTVARTLLDLAETLHPQRLHDALEQTLRIDKFDLDDINATIARNPGRHGIRPLKRTLAELPDIAPRLWSDLEVELARLLRGTDLPPPLTNAVVEGKPVDFYWPDHRLIVEVDGDPWHRLASDRARDAARDRKLTRAGFTVLRVTGTELHADADGVLADIGAHLS